MTAVPVRTLGSPAWTGLAWTLVRTDFKARYHGSAAGFLWALLKPLTMFVVLVGVFSFVFSSDRNYRLNLLLGLFLYEFFADGTRVGVTALHTKGFLLTRARTPIGLLVATSSANAALTLSVFAGALLLFMAGTGWPLSAGRITLFLFYLGILYLLVLGISLATSVLFVRFRDLNQVWDVVAQAGFFVAPVIYPLDTVPPGLRQLFFLWPPTAIIQLSREVLVQGTLPSARAHLLLTVGTVLVLAAGGWTFRRLAPRAAEYL